MSQELQQDPDFSFLWLPQLHIFQSQTLLVPQICSVRKPRSGESAKLSRQHILARALPFHKAICPVAAHQPISWSVRASSFYNLNLIEKFCNSARKFGSEISFFFGVFRNIE